MRDTLELQAIPDDELLRRLAQLLHTSRRAEGDLVAHVGEVDARRLYAREASPSMFAYCTERLHLSEAEAYLRIAAARAAREHPALLEMLADGRLHLTAIAKLAPHLEPENREALLARATHRTKREIEELVAEIAPRPDAATLMRRLPERRVAAPSPLTPRLDPISTAPLAPPTSRGADRVASTDSGRSAEALLPARQLRPDAVAAARPAVVEPLAPGRYRVQFTASAELRDKLERLESRRFGRMRASGKPVQARNVPSSGRAPQEGAAAADQGPTVDKGSPTVTQGSPGARATPHRTRHIPAMIKRAVHERDGGRCRYVDEQGRRCAARDGLEYHHRHPIGFGGRHSVDGISLMCRAHNLYLAEIDYGREAMVRHRRSETEARSLGLET